MKVKTLVGHMELQIAVSVGICIILSNFVWDKIQLMTACVSVLLCTQENAKFSLRSGVTRLIITVIGASAAVLIYMLNGCINNEWISIIFVLIGVLITLAACKLAKVPPISARIGAVSFILVYFTPSASPLTYSIYRLLSTIVGAAVVFIVAIAADLILRHSSGNAAEAAGAPEPLEASEQEPESSASVEL
ncbi:MAG: FUSC family protein [Oscillospiraceae bacterium]